MKKSISLFLVLFSVLFNSCEKDKYTIENDVIRTLTINGTTHTFTDDNETQYIENTLVSQQDQHVYKLEMTKGIQYRISVTQPNTTIVQAKLTLVNVKQDTLSQSITESATKSFIVVTSPETANYYLIVNLQKRTNPVFDYRLYFEEIVDDAISFTGLNWSTNGIWHVNNSNSIEFKNTGSYIYRHLRLVSPLTGNSNISFTIQNSSINNVNFGVILSASADYLQFSEWAYEFPNSGYALLTFKNNLNYAFVRISPGSISYDWNALPSISMDYLAGVKVELRYLSGQYCLYLNNNYIRNMNGTLQNFNIVILDSGDGKTMIKDFQIIN